MVLGWQRISYPPGREQVNAAWLDEVGQVTSVSVLLGTLASPGDSESPLRNLR